MAIIRNFNENVNRKLRNLNYYCVFNGDIIDGIPEREKRKLDPVQRNSRVENLIQYCIKMSENKKIRFGERV